MIAATEYNRSEFDDNMNHWLRRKDINFILNLSAERKRKNEIVLESFSIVLFNSLAHKPRYEE